MERGRDRRFRVVYHSTDGGKTWHEVSVLEGSIIYHSSLDGVYNDGFGNLYTAHEHLTKVAKEA